MTAKKTPGTLLKPGAKPKPIPADATEKIQAFAADGFSVVGVAMKLGTSKDLLNKWMEQNPELQAAFDRGRETERQTLHNMLYRQATEKGNSSAAMFLLKARHGYREGEQMDTANRVSITFTLPGALPLEKYIEASKPLPVGSPAKQLGGTSK